MVKTSDNTHQRKKKPSKSHTYTVERSAIVLPTCIKRSEVVRSKVNSKWWSGWVDKMVPSGLASAVWCLGSRVTHKHTNTETR